MKAVFSQPPVAVSSPPECTGVARVVVVGVLDARAATCMEEFCDRGKAGQLARLEVDLTCVTSVTPEGVNALASCLAKRRCFDGGVGVLVSNDVGRRALLESMADA